MLPLRQAVWSFRCVWDRQGKVSVFYETCIERFTLPETGRGRFQCTMRLSLRGLNCLWDKQWEVYMAFETGSVGFSLPLREAGKGFIETGIERFTLPQTGRGRFQCPMRLALRGLHGLWNRQCEVYIASDRQGKVSVLYETGIERFTLPLGQAVRGLHGLWDRQCEVYIATDSVRFMWPLRLALRDLHCLWGKQWYVYIAYDTSSERLMWLVRPTIRGG